jgi:hypothetical protein
MVHPGTAASLDRRASSPAPAGMDNRHRPVPVTGGRFARSSLDPGEKGMHKSPKWFVPVAVAALLWNLLGCLAYLHDVTLTPADVAKLGAAQQSMYAARPAWAVGATAVAVWFGALGCVGLILRKRWSLPILALSLLGVIVQDIALFGLSGLSASIEPVVYVLQGVVLLIAIGLVLMSRQGRAAQWLS